MKNNKKSVAVILLVIVIIIAGVFIYIRNINRIADPSQPSSITILSPLVGNTLTQGETYNVTWTSSNVGSQDLTISLYSIDKSQLYYLTHSTQNDGTYSWKIDPNLPTGKYKLYVGTGENLPTQGNVAGAETGVFNVISIKE